MIPLPYGTIPAGDTVFVTDGFRNRGLQHYPGSPHAHFSTCMLQLHTRDTWSSSFTLTGHAPVLEMDGYTIDDAGGNNNGRLDPGETATHYGDSTQFGLRRCFRMSSGALSCTNSYLTVNNSPLDYGDIPAGQTGVQIV